MRGGQTLEGINATLAEIGLPPLNRTKGPNPESLPAAPVSIIWSPLPGGSPRVKGNFPGNYWPGSRWVDWVGTDFYSQYPVWEDLNRFYAGKQWKGKPVAITEWAVSGKDEPRFVKQLISWIVKRPRVRMLVYYQGFGPGNPYDLGLYPRTTNTLRLKIRRANFLSYAEYNAGLLPAAAAQGRRSRSRPPVPMGRSHVRPGVSFRPVNGARSSLRRGSGEAREAAGSLAERCGFVVRPAPRCSGDPPAGEFESLLALAVVLEGGVGVVEAAAVGFDDQPGLAPEEVRLVAGLPPATSSQTLTSGCGSSALRHMREEQALELARGSASSADGSCRATRRSRATPRRPRLRSHQRSQLRLVEAAGGLPPAATAFRSSHAGTTPARSSTSGRRSCRGRRRASVLSIGSQRAVPMRGDPPGTPPAPIRRGDVDRLLPSVDQSPEIGGGPMRKDGVRAHRRAPPP